MKYIPTIEFAKLPGNVRDNYLEMSAILATKQGLYPCDTDINEVIKQAEVAFTDFMKNNVSLEILDSARKIADEYTVFHFAFAQATGFISGYIAGNNAK